MKNNKVFLAVVLALAMLSGCAEEDKIPDDLSGTSNDGSSAVIGESSAVQSTSERPVSDPDSSLNSDRPQTSETSNSSEETGDPDATFLVGPAGDTIYRYELSTIFTSDGTDGSPATFSEENFSGVLCDGFVYLADPTGICRTNYDNADVFDSAAMRFTDVPESTGKGYRRVSVGETVCGLTLTEAQSNFARGNDSAEFTLGDGSTKLGSELGFPDIYFMGGSANFSGQLTLTGYISVAADNEHGLEEGSIIFVPSDCECMLPVMGYRFDPDVGIVHYRRMNSHMGLVWENEYGNIFLGNIADTTADLSGVPDDGSFVKAEVTIDNIRLICGIGMMENCTAEIADITFF